MLDSLLFLIPPMLLGTQLILTLVLMKGEICPGQRGRLHKLFPAIGTLWLACSTSNIAALAVAAPLFYFYSRVQTGKTRERGPIWILLLANLCAAGYVVLQMLEQHSLSALLALLISALFLGAAFAHLNLKFAASRLQAFHSLLPITGLISGIALALTMAMQAMQTESVQLAQLSLHIFAGLALLIAGIVVWCMHLLRGVEAGKLQLSLAVLLVMAACISFQPLFIPV